MPGDFVAITHLCDLPFNLQVEEAWLSRVWQCAECHVCWEISALVGLGKNMPMEVTWKRCDPPPARLDADMAELWKDLEIASRDQMRQDSS